MAIDTSMAVAALGVLHNVFYPKPTAAFLTELTDSQLLSAWPEIGDPKEIVEACGRIEQSIEKDGFDAIERDFYRLFIGPGTALAYPWGSVYTDRENLVCGQTMVNFKAFCRGNDIALQTEHTEPVDHIGLMLAVLVELLNRNDGAAVNELLSEHLMPWAPRLFELVLEHGTTDYMKGFAILAGQLLSALVESRGLIVTNKRLYL
ncbi:TorD/DmsD family molecular chaperone [Ferrimonas aestuarii]|nr:molecular chaperone TorD family protein [Ferrimonas aestuarii]